MRIGLLYGMDVPDGCHPADAYQEIMEQIRVADHLGYDSVFFEETHFRDRTLCPSLQIAAGYVATSTHAIRIGTAWKTLPLDDPIRVAEDFAVIDLMSNGRVILGVAPGARQMEFQKYGKTWDTRWECFEEGVDLLIRAWTADAFAYAGKHYHVPGHATGDPKNPFQPEPYTGPFVVPWKRVGKRWEHIASTPKPAQIPHPPVWVGGYGMESVDYAARQGMALLLSPLESLARVREKIDRYRKTAQAAGQNVRGQAIAVARDVFVAPTAAEARRSVEGPLAALYQRHVDDGVLAEAEGKKVAANDLRFDRLAEERCLIGTPDGVLDKIKKLQHETQANHLICRINFPGVPHERVLATIRLFASQVGAMLLA